MRILYKSRSCLLKDSDRHLPRHRRELLQKHIQRIAFFDVVEQVLNGDSRSREDRRATLDVRVYDDQRGIHDVLHCEERQSVYREPNSCPQSWPELALVEVDPAAVRRAER